jgi:putative flavoprotein involved in K+ transport
VATGHADVDALPRFAAALAPEICQVPVSRYREPGELPPGGVLVVGASASGIQIADELLRHGRRVVLACGRHLRMPRSYRGKDILWWLDRTGILHEAARDVYDIDISRRQPSFQLVGRAGDPLDLAALQQRGAEIAGRMTGVVDGTRVAFADDLVATAAASDVKLAGLLQRIDRFIGEHGFETECDPAVGFEPIWPRFTAARRRLHLVDENIRTVIWATGFRRVYPWLQIPGALDAVGEIRNNGGISVVPGLYVLGLQFMRHRNSSFIDGVGRDACALAGHLARHVSGRAVA